jgi:hypothetical protein
LEEVNCVPSLFVTLSCAENPWKIIEKLLNARRKIAGDPPIEFENIINFAKATWALGREEEPGLEGEA